MNLYDIIKPPLADAVSASRTNRKIFHIKPRKRKTSAKRGSKRKSSVDNILNSLSKEQAAQILKTLTEMAGGKT